MLEKYADYTIEDFVKDERFIQWVKRPDTASDSFWLGFLERYPLQEEVVLQARNLVLQLDRATRGPVDPRDASEIWHQVQERIEEASNPVRRWYNSRFTTWLAAASVLVAAIVWWKGPGIVSQKPVGVYAQLTGKSEEVLEERMNKEDTPLIVTLPDGSRVTLEKNSRLSFVRDFNGSSRKVYLSGAAFFEVTKNPGKPFMVYANELVTKVLGTSFSVSAFEEDQRVTVAVKTGKVSVFANKYVNNEDPETKGLILVPNQQVAFSRDKETLIRSLVSMPKIIVPQEDLKHFTFNNAQVSSIFNALEEVYGVEILYDEELMSDCRLTTSLFDETLFERLDVICEAVGATYKVVDAQVVIFGRKCN